MKTLEDVQTWRGMTMVDPDGDKIGTIEDIFLDRQTGEPEWAAVKTGLFGLKRSLVPITDAEATDDNQVRVPYQKEQVKDAPKVDPDGELSADEERKLWEHYGRSDYGDWQGDDQTTALDLPAEPGTRFEPPGEDSEDVVPAIVGVRLRRVIVVAAVPDDAEQDAPTPR